MGRIEARHHARLFERFYRVTAAATESEEVQAWGISNTLVGLKGTIRYEERQPHGSRFVLALKPAKQEEKSRFSVLNRRR